MEDYLKDEKTVQAIKDSVRHWEEDVVGRITDGELPIYGANSCALCQKFDNEGGCPKCPLDLRKMSCEDKDSLYQIFRQCQTVENAQNMVLALKSLFYPEEPKKEEVFYHIGQRFICNNEELILAQVGYHKVAFIHLNGEYNGNRKADPVDIHASRKITESEFKQICGSETFTYHLIQAVP